MTSVLSSGPKTYQDMNILAQQGSERRFWKDQRQILRNGLIKCEKLQRMFNVLQCIQLTQDLLWVYQQKGLRLHFSSFTFTQTNLNEKISYKCFVGSKCREKTIQINANESPARAIGQFLIHYRILRIPPEKIACKYPYLLLFGVQTGHYFCELCLSNHRFGIALSSFYAIRSQFVHMLIKKIAFMEMYPRYEFTPFNFLSKQPNAETPYEYVKNWERCCYVQRCQSLMVNFLKLQIVKRQMDCQTVSLESLCQGDQKLIEKYKKAMASIQFWCKVKYFCKKTQNTHVWTSRSLVVIHFGIYELKKYFKQRVQTIKAEDRRFTFDESNILANYRNSFRKEENMTPQDSFEGKMSMQKFYKISQYRIDRSIEKEQRQLQAFQHDTQGCFAFHKDLKDYKWPYLIFFSIHLPKMSCRTCCEENNGLAYICSLVSEARSKLIDKVMSRIKKVHNGKRKDLGKG